MDKENITNVNVHPLGSFAITSTFERCFSLYNFAGCTWIWLSIREAMRPILATKKILELREELNRLKNHARNTQYETQGSFIIRRLKIENLHKPEKIIQILKLPLELHLWNILILVEKLLFVDLFLLLQKENHKWN